jgi:NADPH2:quinone reductase
VPPVDPQTLNAKGSLFLTRPFLSHYTADRLELMERADAIFNWIISGELIVRVGRTFALAQAAEAHRYLEGRHSTGKVLLLP